MSVTEDKGKHKRRTTKKSLDEILNLGRYTLLNNL